MFCKVINIRSEQAAQRVSFGAGYPADVHAIIPVDVRGQKLQSGPRNPGRKNKHFGADIHNPTADVHDPRGVFKNFGQRNFVLNLRSLL